MKEFLDILDLDNFLVARIKKNKEGIKVSTNNKNLNKAINRWIKFGLSEYVDDCPRITFSDSPFFLLRLADYLKRTTSQFKIYSHYET